MNNNNYLSHYGILGMKWGRRKAPATLQVNKNHSSVTKNVINDYNTMDDKQFFRKYRASKNTYAGRVEKYGDPYMNAPLAKLGKKLNKGEKVKTSSLVKAAVKEAWDRTPSVDKVTATVGATIATGMVAYKALQGAGVLAKTLQGAVKEASLGRKVAYKVLDEFGNTIAKGRTGVL